MTIIPEGAHEEVSITGTAFSRIPLTGQPECTGLLVADDAPAVARIEDGALVIDVNDLDLALAWRNAWQQACSHLIEHKRRQVERAAKAETLPTTGATCGQPGCGIRLWRIEGTWVHEHNKHEECQPGAQPPRWAAPTEQEYLRPEGLTEADVRECGVFVCKGEIYRNRLLGQWEHSETGEAACFPDRSNSPYADPAPDDGLTTTAARREQDREGRS